MKIVQLRLAADFSTKASERIIDIVQVDIPVGGMR